MKSGSREAVAVRQEDMGQINLFKKLKTKSAKTESGDQRTMDAADTLVSLAHSASSTPTVESKPFRPLDEIIEKTINLDEITSEKQNTSLIESACKILVEQVLKSCPNADLSTITIKASTKAKKKCDREAESDTDSESTRGGRSAPTLATGRRSRDLELPPDEARKRQERRERNKHAAARCRRRREQLAETLSQKTNQLSQEQDQLNKSYQDLVKQKVEWERIYNEHVKACVKDKPEESGSMALTPISAGLNQKENYLNLFESSEKIKNGLTRPNNLNLKSTNFTSTSNIGSMTTPSSATLNSVLQGIALAFGQANTPGSFSIGSNNNISFLMTPTFQLNTPTAFLSLTPIESQFGTLNTPMIIQSNPFLTVHDSTSKSGESATKS